MTEKQSIINNILGGYKRVSGECLYHCPYCGHHKKKMSINFAKNAFKCWICDERGKNIYRIVRKFGTFQQRQRWLELDGRLDLSEFDKLFMALNDQKIEPTTELPPEFISLCNIHLPRSSQRPLQYLHERGLTQKDIFNWKIGYCPEGEYGGRIIIPSFNNNGDINYYIARSYVGHSWKYKNPPVSKNVIFNELSIDWDESVVLVEGVFDAIVAGTNAIPILGSTLRDNTKLFQAIVLNDSPVYLALDSDADKKLSYIVKNLLKYDIEAYKIDTSGIEDVGSITKAQYDVLQQQAEPISFDDFFLMDELRRVM